MDEEIVQIREEFLTACTSCMCARKNKCKDTNERNYYVYAQHHNCHKYKARSWSKVLISVIVSCLMFPSCVQGQSYVNRPTMNAMSDETIGAQLQYYDPKQYNATSKNPEHFWGEFMQTTLQQEEDSEYEYEMVNDDYDTKEQQEIPIVVQEVFTDPQASVPRKGCPNGECAVPSEESRLLAIEKLKLKILERLDLKDPLNMTIPKISFDTPPMRSLFRKHGFKVDRENPSRVLSDIDEHVTVKEKRIISVASPVPEHIGNRGIQFTFSEDELQQEVCSATLWVYILRNPTSDRHMNFHLSRYQRTGSGVVELVQFQTKVLHIPPNAKHGSWRKFDIQGTVYSWFSETETNLGMVISSSTHPQLIADGTSQETMKHKPMVEVDIISDVNSRRKRLVCTGHPDENETRCCRYSTVINFDAIGWEFVIAPKNFNIHYCAGDCPFIMLKSGFKRMLTQYPLGLGNERMRKGAQGCCSPDKLKPLSLLYFDNQQNVIYSTLPDMIVEECGCL